MVLESKGEKTLEMVLQLLKSLSVSTVITLDQMRRVRQESSITPLFHQASFVEPALNDAV